MKFPDLDKRKHIGKIVLTYAGAAWVIIQVVSLIISQYKWPIALLDVTILIFIFGLPSVFFYALYGNEVNKRLKFIYGVNIILIIGIIGYYFLKPDSIQPNQIKFLKFKDNQKELAKNIGSIAILPFSNFTGDSDKDYLSYAIHDALTKEMGSVSSLRIISQTSTVAISGQNKSLQEIASELNVDAVIEGSILSVDDNIKVNVSLINAFPHEVQIWTNDYTESMASLLNVYSKITQNLAHEINLPLTPEEKDNLNKERTVIPAAYEAYLKGKYNMGLLTQEGIMASQEYFNKAIELDPEFAPAYAALGGVWGFLKQMNFVSADEANKYFIPNIEKAMSLDSTMAEVHYWSAIKYVWTDYNWLEGEKSFRRAIKLNPNSSETRGLFSNYLLTQNRIDEARREMDKALELDPKNPFILTLNTVNLYNEENYEAVIELGSSIQKMMPENPLVNLALFMSYAQIGDHDALFEQAKIWLTLEKHEDVIPVFEEAYKNGNIKVAFQEVANKLEEKDNSKLMAQTMFQFYLQAGDTDKTLDWISTSYMRQDPDIPAINVIPVLDKYRDHPRFKEIISRLKFTNVKTLNN